MELELWSEMSAAISGVATNWPRHPRDQYSTATVVRVHQWACLHDRPVRWACRPENWSPAVRPEGLPDQSTMSRRTRRGDFMRFLRRVGERLNGKAKPALVKVVDGKPLELPNHSGDPDATWGRRGVSRTAVGYKIHAVWSGNPMPDALAITTLNVCEKRMAARLIAGAWGAAVTCWATPTTMPVGCSITVMPITTSCSVPGPSPGPAKVTTACRPHRRRSVAMLEVPGAVNCFGRELYDRRTDIERDFSQLTCFGAGLGPLPSWVRRIWRVRNWVVGKLLVNACRIRINRRKAA